MSRTTEPFLAEAQGSDQVEEAGMSGPGLAEGHTPDKMYPLSSAVAILDRQEHAADFEAGYVCRCTGASDSSI